jgi:hypothetical protein
MIVFGSIVFGNTYAGTPDLKLTDASVFQYLGNARFQSQADSKDKLSFLDYKTRPEHGENSIWVDAWYSTSEKPGRLVKMQFVKKENGWEFLRELKPHQVLLAHPVVPFDGQTFDEKGDNLSKAIDYLTATAFEADFHHQFPDKECWWVRIGLNYSHNKKSGIGKNRVSFRLSRKGEWISWDYLMRVKDGQWMIERRLKEGERVNTRTGQVETFVAVGGKTLSEAVFREDEELVSKLLSNGAQIDSSTKLGLGLIEYSIAMGNEGIVDELLKAGVDVNKKDHFGNTPLFTAALWDKTSIAKKLIRAAADFNAVNKEGYSPLDIASMWDNKKTEEFLRSIGAVGGKNGSGGIAHFGPEEISEIASEIDSGLYLKFFKKDRNGNAPEMTVFLSGKKGILPEGKTVRIHYERKESDSLVNNILYRSKRSDTGKDISDWINGDDYSIELTFGAITDGVLPGSITVDYPKANLRFKTDFKAEIRGLRIVDGHPDLASDSMETLCYAAELYLEKKYNREHIDVQQAEGNYSSWFSHSEHGGLQVGGVDVYYDHLGQKMFLRVQLCKKDGIWGVANELRGNQLFAAHPLEEVDENDTKKYLQLLAYQRLEQDLQKEQPDGVFRAVSFASVRRSKEMSQVTVSYYVEGDDEELKRKYLLEFIDNRWQVKRQLAENEKLDTRKNVIKKSK